jgi:mono/diheme cytochrome c family protein
MRLRGGSTLALVWLALVWLALGAACALPWRDYPVSPAVYGTIDRGAEAVTTGRVRLQVRSRDNAALGGHREVVPGDDGSFAFDQLALAVAGQEYGKLYVLLLYWLEGDHAVTLWRADYSRRQLGGPIELACDLARPREEGTPCRFVGDAREQPWLLEAGARDYRRLCASCHGADARGGGPAAANLRGSPPDLTRIAARRGGVFPYDELAAWLDGRDVAAHGSREMPIWGIRLADETLPGGISGDRVRTRIDVLVEYLETLQLP